MKIFNKKSIFDFLKRFTFKKFFTLTLLLIGRFIQTKTVNLINDITVENIEQILGKIKEKKKKILILVIDYTVNTSWCQPYKQIESVVDTYRKN